MGELTTGWTKASASCRGKAPPVDPFSGDDPILEFED